MEVLIDIGNTTCGVSFYENGTYTSFAVATKKDETPSYYKAQFLNVVPKELIEKKCEGIIISSVVPELTNIIKEVFENHYHKEAILVSTKLKTNMPILLDNPSELGSDLLCTAIGAVSKYTKPIIVCDLGTATKLSGVDKDGNYLGGAITLGLGLTNKILSNNASLLPSIAMSSDIKAVGANTIDAMNSGIVMGHTHLVDGLINDFLNDSRLKDATIILTGGNSKYIRPLMKTKFIYEEDLIYFGLHTLLKLNS